HEPPRENPGSNAPVVHLPCDMRETIAPPFAQPQGFVSKKPIPKAAKDLRNVFSSRTRGKYSAVTTSQMTNSPANPAYPNSSTQSAAESSPLAMARSTEESTAVIISGTANQPDLLVPPTTRECFFQRAVPWQYR